MKESFTDQDIFYMRAAIDEARAAAESGDVPVGALLVDHKKRQVVARGRNTRELMGNALGHAEINVIAEGCRAQGGWRLEDCTLYVTLEPCPMCAGAILHARISRVVCGAADPVAGAMGSVWALHKHPVENRHTSVEYGCLEEECRDLLKEFFEERRRGEE